MCYTDHVSICIYPNVNWSFLFSSPFGGTQTDRKFIKQICKEGEQLENYTKYKLKAEEELVQALAPTDKIFVIACNKCFKEFDTGFFCLFV